MFVVVPPPPLHPTHREMANTSNGIAMMGRMEEERKWGSPEDVRRRQTSGHGVRVRWAE